MEKVRMPGVSAPDFSEADFARMPRHSIAFSSEVGIGSRQETGQTKRGKPGPDSSKPEWLKKLRERAFFLFFRAALAGSVSSAGWGWR
jgi:hypothetical protein